MRRKRNLTPRLERCAHLQISEPETLRGKWLETFVYNELHIELGCGKGRFIAQTAAGSPDTFFIALEKSENVLVSAMERAARDSLQNVCFINTFAENLSNLFAPDEVSRIYINFCDPWPSPRHIKRRLTAGSFLQTYRIILESGGEIHFKTDNRPLFEFSLRELDRFEFKLLETDYDFHKNIQPGIMTEYEQKFYEHGQPVYRCRAQA